MAEIRDVGHLVDHSFGPGPLPPMSFDAIEAAAGDGGGLSNDELDKKIKAQMADEPSIWFVNIPTSGNWAQGSAALKEYSQDVLNYRSWASGVWWRTVFAQKALPSGEEPEALRQRSAYLAKVAGFHMKQTPWLAMSSDRNVERDIEASENDFHSQLITDVLSGFVSVQEGIKKTLETVLISLTKTVKQSSSAKDFKTIVCERYEYIQEIDSIRSSVRVISFQVNEDMKRVSDKHGTNTTVKCKIGYNEYEAIFNRQQWLDVWPSLKETVSQGAKDFAGKNTVECDPP